MATSLAAALACSPAWAAGQRYAVTGRDSYQIGQNNLGTRIDYEGTQQLSVVRAGNTTRFVAQVRYTRVERGGGKVPARASFVQEMTPAGNLRDRSDADPDYLTVLNQPFAIQLDAATLRDIVHLQGRVPFDFPSPMTGGSLHGYLERSPGARIDGRGAVGVRFDADGPMVGPLPDHPAIAISGKMRMKGTAYYATHGALLLGLEETLTITGTLSDRGKKTPVTIVYVRSIKADAAQPALTEAGK